MKYVTYDIRVSTVDVGYGQFDWGLRNDERVICMEKTNIRYVTPDDIDDVLDFASCDVSFISLSKVLPTAHNLLSGNGEMAVLIKPQFEAGKDKVGKKGVVRDPKIHKEVIEDVSASVKEIGFVIKGLDYSPIKGPEGNIEYLMYVRSPDGTEDIGEERIAQVVSMAHEELDK